MEEKVKKACDMLYTALEMEKKGKAFYDKSAGQCKNEQCRDIFRMLGQDEVAHMERIKTVHDSLAKQQAWCEDWKRIEPAFESLSKIFRKMARKHGANISSDASDLEALDIGIEFEVQSISFYQQREKDAKDPLEKEFLLQMAAEEKDHHRALTDMKLYLENPSAWFNEREKSHWDGA